MTKTSIRKFKYRVGKNRYLIIKIVQSTVARTDQGNALASNAVNVSIFKQKGRRRRGR